MSHRPVVLVVEDEPGVRTTLCATLNVLGFNTVSASDIQEALTILGNQQVDAVTLDVRMPDPRGMQWSGLSLLSFLRTTPDHRHLPIAVFTGMPLSAEEERLIQRHNATVFYKPLRYVVLAEHLSRVLAHGLIAHRELSRLDCR